LYEDAGSGTEGAARPSVSTAGGGSWLGIDPDAVVAVMNRGQRMRIAILSDIHDNIWKLAAALERIQDAEALTCCGDLCAPFIVPQLAEGFPGPIHVVFGNNDGDRFNIQRQAQRFDHVTIHGELAELTLGGKRIAVHHFDNVGRLIAAAGVYDVVCYGHNHVFEVGRDGKTLRINPGEIMGRLGTATYVVYDTETDEATRYEV
jgi:uncharacterized protein